MWLSFHAFMRLIFTNIIMQHTSHFKWLHHHPSKAQEPSHCHHGDRRSPTPTLAELSEKSVTRQLHPNFHSVSVMFPEWNCLSGLAPLKPIIVLRPVLGWPAGLTCHSNCLTHSPPNHTCRKQRITFHSGVSSSHVVIPYWLQRLVVVTARRHCWKWHWQIITHQCVWQCQHIWLAQTRACMRNQTFFYFFLVGHSGDWLVILSHHLHNLILRYNVKLFTPHPWSRKVCFKFPSFIRPCQPSVLLSSYTQPTHQHTHTCACDLIYHDCWDRCLPVCWKVKVHICVPKGKCAALERLCSSHPVSTC